MKNIQQWFTAERRQQVQLFLGSLAPLAILFGFGTEGTWEQVLIIAGAALQFVASLLSLINVKAEAWATQGWAIIRGAIYALGFTVSPALVLLGFYGEDVNATLLMGLSLALSSLSSLVAIFTSGKQQQQELVQIFTREGPLTK